MQTVLVTGATGFIGRALVPRLAGGGYRVRRAVRAVAGPEDFAAGDLADLPNWSAALTGVYGVVHLAASVHNRGGDFFRINRDATLDLARQAKAAGVKVFVFLSTVKVCGEASPADTPFDEESPCRPEDDYGRAKLEAEEGLRDLADENFHILVLRPPLVYGAEVGANFRRLLQAVDLRLPLPLAGVAARRSLLHRENLVDAIAIALAKPAPAPWRCYFVSDGDDPSVAELFYRLGDALGRRPRLFTLPPSWLEAACDWPYVGPMLARLTRPLQVDSGRIRRELGWVPPLSLVEGICDAAGWWREVKKK